MEERIKKYENFVKKEVKNGNKSEKLYLLHCEMVRNFQHERLIHLIVTLFFAFMVVCFIGVSFLFALAVPNECWYVAVPVYLITLILTILVIFYIKHYYFLENHVQKLYDITTEMASRNN